MKERAIVGEVIVEGELEEVWQAWTTEQGVISFFAPECKLDLRPGSAYEIYFAPDSPEGSRGAEGCTVMTVQPMKLFSFTWTAPPSIPTIRGQLTHVVIRFEPLPEGTRVTLYHDGWGSGPDWDRAFEYFERAWNKIVLPLLAYRFRHGEVDWEHPPNLGEG